MNSSGIKRGLATTAISALAVVGLPALAGIAQADDLASQAPGPNRVEIQTPTTVASVKNDGVNSTVRLLATGGANVIQVKFSYSTDGISWTDIDTVSRTNGAFSVEWAPPTALYNTPVQIKAQQINDLDIEFGTPDIETAVEVSSNKEAVDISNAAGSSVGVFQQPYAGPNDKLLGSVSATTSDVADNPDVMFSALGGGAPMDEDTVGTPADGSNSVSGVVDFTGYTFDATDPKVDEAIVIAQAGGSDAEAVTLYQQEIAGMSVTPEAVTLPGTSSTQATVTVVDQDGKPVSGAEVVQSQQADGSFPTATHYTDSQGQTTFTVWGDVNGLKHYFFVNTTGNAAYEPALDRRVDMSVTNYDAVPGSLTTSSKDGAAFDIDENESGDVSGVLKDQNGNPLDGKVVSYAWEIAPFAEQAGYPKMLTQQSATSGPDGKVDFTVPTGEPSGTYTLHAFRDTNGTPGQQAEELAAENLVVKVGQAEITWSDETVAQTASGTTGTYEGSMALEDGTVLSGRDVTITWTKTGDAVVAAQSAQPAGTTRNGNGSATAKTGADGSFSVAVADHNPPTPVDELGGMLKARYSDANGLVVPAAALQVDFMKNLAVDKTQSTNSVVTDKIAGDATPGRPVQLDVTVKNSEGQALTDLPVEISTDHGFFTPQAEDGNADSLSELTPDPAAAQGAEYGLWKDLGSQITDETDDTGLVSAVVAIGRDAGFDDDGQVTATVTFEVGGQEIVQEVDFSSLNPMNPGEVTIELSEDQDSAILPDAQSYLDSVGYHVFATDSFGNLTQQTVELENDNPDAEISNNWATSQWKGDQSVAVFAWTPDDTDSDQVITGTWENADTQVWTDADTGTDGFQAEAGGADGVKSDTKDVVGESDAIHWYTVDRANSTYTLTHTGEDTQKVGDIVKTTFKAVDQKGQPIDDLDVGFFRTGPDDLQDGEGNALRNTNANGEATYIYQGAKPGTAVVTVLAQDWHDELIDTAELSSSVTFEVEKSAGLKAIVAKLKGANNGKKADRVKVKAPNAAAGAKVRLYKVVKGKLKKVDAGVLNGKGDKTFKVKDRNGNKVTKYVAKVGKTSATKADKTNVRRIR